MARFGRIVVVAALVMGALVSRAAWAVDADEEAAVKAATEWLALADAGNYTKSWEAASSSFRSAITKEKWVALMNDNRKPVGKVVSRTMDGKKLTSELPGMPACQGYILHYKTSFEKKEGVSETVTPVMDKDGVWRVSGYYLR